MRVLAVNHTARVSGGERSLLDLLAGIGDRAEITVACPRGDLAEAVRRLGVAVDPIPELDLSLRFDPIASASGLVALGEAAVSVGRIARSRGVDLVHANSIRAGLICSAIPGPPLLVHVRDCLPGGSVPWATRRLIARRAALIVANSGHTARNFARSRRLPIRVIHSPVDLARFDPSLVTREDARAAVGLPGDAPLLGVVGQLSPWKGQDDAIRLTALLARQHPGVRLAVVGAAVFGSGATRYDNRAYAEGLAHLATTLRIADRVHLLGHRDDIPAVMRALDVLLVPSWEEPFGRAVVEGMAMETAVAATSAGGPAELIIDRLHGLLLPPRLPDRWVEPVSSLLADSGRRQRMGQRARARMLAMSGVERHTEAILDAYRTVANREAVAVPLEGGRHLPASEGARQPGA